jgi:hypothetical protein
VKICNGNDQPAWTGDLGDEVQHTELLISLDATSREREYLEK